MLAIFIGASCLIALIVTLILKSKMKSVRTGTEASAYVVGGLQLINSSDVYTHTTETRTKIESESDSGSDGSHSGGGGSGRSSHF